MLKSPKQAVVHVIIASHLEKLSKYTQNALKPSLPSLPSFLRHRQATRVRSDQGPRPKTRPVVALSSLREAYFCNGFFREPTFFSSRQGSEHNPESPSMGT